MDTKIVATRDKAEDTCRPLSLSHMSIAPYWGVGTGKETVTAG